MAKKFKDLRARMTPESRKKAERLYREAVQEMALNDLRKARGLTQTELAATLDMKQASVSKIEHQTDLYVSTLRRFVEACGGKLLITAVFPSGTVQVTRLGVDPEAVHETK